MRACRDVAHTAPRDLQTVAVLEVAQVRVRTSTEYASMLCELVLVVVKYYLLVLVFRTLYRLYIMLWIAVYTT